MVEINDRITRELSDNSYHPPTKPTCEWHTKRMEVLGAASVAPSTKMLCPELPSNVKGLALYWPDADTYNNRPTADRLTYLYDTDQIPPDYQIPVIW